MDPQNNAGENQGAPTSSTPIIDHAQNRTLMGVLSYLGPLVIIPFMMAKNDSFVKFHIKQGVVVFALEIIVWILGMIMMYQLWVILQILNLCTLILSIVGIVNVIQKHEKELPVVGKFSSYVKI